MVWYNDKYFDGGARIRILVLTILISGILLFPAYSIQNAEAEKEEPADYYVLLTLDIEFRSTSEGNLHLYFGTTGESTMPTVTNLDANLTSYNNKYLNLTYYGFLAYSDSNESMLRSVLNTNCGLDLRNICLKMVSSYDRFGIAFDCVFMFNSSARDRIFSYLDFLKDINFGDIGENLLSDVFITTDSVRILFNIDLDSGLSLDKDSDNHSHSRAITSESYSESTTLTNFLASSNEFIISSNKLKSPTGVFIETALILLIGYGLLLFIWWKKRFIGFGLILPVASIVYSILVMFAFFNPRYSIYGIGGLSVVFFAMGFVFLVSLTWPINPKIKMADFKDEKRHYKRKKFERPKIIYVDRFIERPMRSRYATETELDPYAVLGITPGASKEEIKKAYFKKIKEYHPDKYDAHPEKIKSAALKETEKLNQAFEMLTKKGGGD